MARTTSDEPIHLDEVRSRRNRPPIKPRDKGVLFHDEGPTGWGRIRRLDDYKGNKSELNFDDDKRLVEEND